MGKETSRNILKAFHEWGGSRLLMKEGDSWQQSFLPAAKHVKTNNSLKSLKKRNIEPSFLFPPKLAARGRAERELRKIPPTDDL